MNYIVELKKLPGYRENIERYAIVEYESLLHNNQSLLRRMSQHGY